MFHFELLNLDIEKCLTVPLKNIKLKKAKVKISPDFTTFHKNL